MHTKVLIGVHSGEKENVCSFFLSYALFCLTVFIPSTPHFNILEIVLKTLIKLYIKQNFPDQFFGSAAQVVSLGPAPVSFSVSSLRLPESPVPLLTLSSISQHQQGLDKVVTKKSY